MSDKTKRYVATAEELRQNNCHADRKTIGTIENKEGEVYMIDSVNAVIRHTGENAVPLLPCNLPAALQKAGTKIIFSGEIKEMGLSEFWAARPFVLTRAEEK